MFPTHLSLCYIIVGVCLSWHINNFTNSSFRIYIFIVFYTMSTHVPLRLNAKLYLSSHSIQKEKVLLFLQQFKSKLNWKNANKILDIGCGPGDITANYLLSPAPEHAEMIAVDISPDMIKLANETFSDSRLRFEVGDISDPKFGENYNGYFDTVFSFYCLHFVQNQWYSILSYKEAKQAMKNIHDVLKPGGETLFTIIVDGPIYTLDRIIAKREKWAPYMQHQEKVLSPYLNVENADDKMKNLLLEVGFVVEECFLFDMTHKMPSKEDFFKFVQSVNPYLGQIPEHLHEEYFEECKKEYFSNVVTVSDETGEVSFTSTNMIVFAKKPYIQ